MLAPFIKSIPAKKDYLVVRTAEVYYVTIPPTPVETSREMPEKINLQAKNREVVLMTYYLQTG
jgi:hypothetical protein